MREGWIVKIVSINGRGKVHKTSFMEYGGLQDCMRIVLSFRAKRGYELEKFEIERGRTLV